MNNDKVCRPGSKRAVAVATSHEGYRRRGRGHPVFCIFVRAVARLLGCPLVWLPSRGVHRTASGAEARGRLAQDVSAPRAPREGREEGDGDGSPWTGASASPSAFPPEKKRTVLDPRPLRQEEEAIVLAEAEAAAKKEADEKRKKQQAARRKKAADKKAAEDQVAAPLHRHPRAQSTPNGRPARSLKTRPRKLPPRPP